MTDLYFYLVFNRSTDSIKSLQANLKLDFGSVPFWRSALYSMNGSGVLLGNNSKNDSTKY